MDRCHHLLQGRLQLRDDLVAAFADEVQPIRFRRVVAFETIAPQCQHRSADGVLDLVDRLPLWPQNQANDAFRIGALRPLATLRHENPLRLRPLSRTSLNTTLRRCMIIKPDVTAVTDLAGLRVRDPENLVHRAKSLQPLLLVLFVGQRVDPNLPVPRHRSHLGPLGHCQLVHVDFDGQPIAAPTLFIIRSVLPPLSSSRT
mmetsp:Transcript_13742/g.34852  ORF Transcript_13742/g.34852 Transcript_13742/m.34852 type:complete len:201 (+) Transcript_13742:725-1327(+)